MADQGSQPAFEGMENTWPMFEGMQLNKAILTFAGEVPLTPEVYRSLGYLAETEVQIRGIVTGKKVSAKAEGANVGNATITVLGVSFPLVGVDVVTKAGEKRAKRVEPEEQDGDDEGELEDDPESEIPGTIEETEGEPVFPDGADMESAARRATSRRQREQDRLTEQIREVEAQDAGRSVLDEALEIAGAKA